MIPTEHAVVCLFSATLSKGAQLLPALQPHNPASMLGGSPDRVATSCSGAPEHGPAEDSANK